jgi:hypothetical protein
LIDKKIEQHLLEFMVNDKNLYISNKLCKENRNFYTYDLHVSRLTAANYLNKLADDGLLIKRRLGTSNYYINEPLFNLLTKR